MLSNNVYYDHIIVPKEIRDKFRVEGKSAIRVLCTVNDNDYFHAGLMPKGDGDYFIIMKKARMKAFGLEIGQEIKVQLEVDTSKYGMRMPEEFEEVLGSDPEGEERFEQLTDGKKRNLIHMVATVKNTDLRITKSLIILDHLKTNEGKLDHKLLLEAMKPKNRKY